MTCGFECAVTIFTCCQAACPCGTSFTGPSTETGAGTASRPVRGDAAAPPGCGGGRCRQAGTASRPGRGSGFFSAFGALPFFTFFSFLSFLFTFLSAISSIFMLCRFFLAAVMISSISLTGTRSLLSASHASLNSSRGSFFSTVRRSLRLKCTTSSSCGSSFGAALCIAAAPASGPGSGRGCGGGAAEAAWYPLPSHVWGSHVGCHVGCHRSDSSCWLWHSCHWLRPPPAAAAHAVARRGLAPQ
mmetsp:Transcript_116460/g.250187  ORF Transcript_116460/g.250187 Transcript_116460/m.250187 type:complete len:244 (-) Transcript_116460:89-820(-)